MKGETVITENELPPQVVLEISRGRKIVAIKLLREATGMGLANAKVLVDRASLRHAPPKRQPPGFHEESNNARLFGMLVLLMAAFLVYRLYFMP